jgi:hypothetical protein
LTAVVHGFREELKHEVEDAHKRGLGGKEIS